MDRNLRGLAAGLLGGLLWGLGLPGAALADPGPGLMQVRDFHRGHGVRGRVVTHLPPAHRTIYFGGLAWYFGAGLWYRPWESGYVVVAPPVGITVPVLPDGYITVYRGDRTYYRHEDVFYVRSPQGYEVVEPPEAFAGSRAARDDIYVYPRDGQGERLQRDDRFDCHEWATEQTGYDPTLAGGGTGYSATRRSDYLRALSACLEGRGYTVR